MAIVYLRLDQWDYIAYLHLSKLWIHVMVVMLSMCTACVHMQACWAVGVLTLSLLSCICACVIVLARAATYVCTRILHLFVGHMTLPSVHHQVHMHMHNEYFMQGCVAMKKLTSSSFNWWT